MIQTKISKTTKARVYVGVNVFDKDRDSVIAYKEQWDVEQQNLFVNGIKSYAYILKRQIENMKIDLTELPQIDTTIFELLTDCKNDILKIGVMRLSKENLKESVQDYNLKELSFDIAIDFRGKNSKSAIKGDNFRALVRELKSIMKLFPHKKFYVEILGDSSRIARGFGSSEGIEHLIHLLRNPRIKIHNFLKLFSEGLKQITLEKTAIGLLKSAKESHQKAGKSSIETFSKTRLEWSEETALRYGLEVGDKEIIEFLKTHYYSKNKVQELERENQELKEMIAQLLAKM